MIYDNNYLESRLKIVRNQFASLEQSFMHSHAYKMNPNVPLFTLWYGVVLQSEIKNHRSSDTTKGVRFLWTDNVLTKALAHQLLRGTISSHYEVWDSLLRGVAVSTLLYFQQRDEFTQKLLNNSFIKTNKIRKRTKQICNKSFFNILIFLYTIKVQCFYIVLLRCYIMICFHLVQIILSLRSSIYKLSYIIFWCHNHVKFTWCFKAGLK